MDHTSQSTAPAPVQQAVPQVVVQPSAPVAAPQVVAPVQQVIPQPATAPASPSFDQIFDQQLAAAQASGQAPQAPQAQFTPAAPQAQQPQPPAQPQPSRGLLDGLKSRGLDTSGFQSDEDLLNEFASAFPQVQQIPQLRAAADQLAALQYQQQLAQQPQAPQQPTAPSLMTKGWDAPEFDDAWMDMVQLDEASGQYVPKNQFVNPDLARKVNARLQWERTAARKLVADPMAALGSSIEEKAAQIADQRIKEFFDNQQRQQQAAAFTQQHKADLYVLAQDGNPVRDAMGNEVLTPLGQVALHHAQLAQSLPFEARQQYVANQVQFAKWQMQQQAQAQMQQQQPVATAPQPAPAPTPQQRRDLFLNQASQVAQGGYQANQSTAMSTPGTPPGLGMRQQGLVRGEDLFENFAMQMAAQNGLVNQTAQPPMATATY